MPTSPIFTYSENFLQPLKYPEHAREENVNLVAGTYAAGTVVGEVTATPGTFKTYATGNVDGSGVAKALVKYPCVVDASGFVSFGDTAGGELRGAGQKGVPVYRNGVFATQDLVGLDADALVDLQARIVRGDLTSGEVVIPG